MNHSDHIAPSGSIKSPAHIKPPAYWQKSPNLAKFQDLEWNIPEQKMGTLSLIGGNLHSFSTVIRSAEFLQTNYPLETLHVVLPDATKSNLPPLPNLVFTPSTESGSFAKSRALNQAASATDFAVFIGDLSKNSATTIAVSEAIKNSSAPVLLARDSIDLVAPELPNLIEHERLFFVASMAQLQKVFRAVYYPKVLLLSMPLMQVVEALHKFTLSYNVTIFTFHQDQIIIANSGKILTIPLEKTSYTPLGLWSGNLICKIAALNLYNPSDPLSATAAALAS